MVVTALYDRGEVPTAAAQQAVQAPAGGTQGGSTARAGRRPAQGPGRGGRSARAGRAAPVGERPAAVAAAWYAARHGVPRAKVKSLQQDRLSANEVRVLVLADHGHGRLRTGAGPAASRRRRLERPVSTRRRRANAGWDARVRIGGGGVVVALLLLGLLAGVASPGFPVRRAAAVGRAVAGAARWEPDRRRPRRRGRRAAAPTSGPATPPWPTSRPTTWAGT